MAGEAGAHIPAYGPPSMSCNQSHGDPVEGARLPDSRRHRILGVGGRRGGGEALAAGGRSPVEEGSAGEGSSEEGTDSAEGTGLEGDIGSEGDTGSEEADDSHPDCILLGCSRLDCNRLDCILLGCSRPSQTSSQWGR